MSEVAMPELSHDEALKHVLHDEIVERLDTIIALLEQKDPEPQDISLFWRVSKRLDRARELIQRAAKDYLNVQRQDRLAEPAPTKPLMTHEQAERFAPFLRRELERRGMLRPQPTDGESNASQ